LVNSLFQEGIHPRAVADRIDVLVQAFPQFDPHPGKLEQVRWIHFNHDTHIASAYIASISKSLSIRAATRPVCFFQTLEKLLLDYFGF
jgi:hypothetical protein